MGLLDFISKGTSNTQSDGDSTTTTPIVQDPATQTQGTNGQFSDVQYPMPVQPIVASDEFSQYTFDPNKLPVNNLQGNDGVSDITQTAPLNPAMNNIQDLNVEDLTKYNSVNDPVSQPSLVDLTQPEYISQAAPATQQSYNTLNDFNHNPQSNLPEVDTFETFQQTPVSNAPINNPFENTQLPTSTIAPQDMGFGTNQVATEPLTNEISNPVNNDILEINNPPSTIEPELPVISNTAIASGMNDLALTNITPSEPIVDIAPINSTIEEVPIPIQNEIQPGTNVPQELVMGGNDVAMNTNVQPQIPEIPIPADISFGNETSSQPEKTETKELKPDLNTEEPLKVDASVEEEKKEPEIELVSENIHEKKSKKKKDEDNEKIDEEIQPQKENIEKETRELKSDYDFKKIKNIAFLGLNSKTFNTVSNELNSLGKFLANKKMNILIDSNKGYGADLVSTLEEIDKAKITAVHFKPFYTNYSDEMENHTKMHDYTTVVYSDLVERLKYFIRESEAFIIPETSGLLNLSSLSLLLSLQHLYMGQHKPVILIGNKWESKINQLKSLAGLSDEEFKSIIIATKAEDAVKILSETDERLLSESKVKARRFYDYREDFDEYEYMN